ncbi:hypothetical protein N0V88_001795 [Collariella sp. IMI 366227]|nr:hypothetical protein N0V88_001795 [Collariella sp. IMI 366227]
MARRPSDAFSQHSAASEAPSALRRRMSMEEDMFYREMMTSRPAKPPSYESAVKAAINAQRKAERSPGPHHEPGDVLPPYSCAVQMEGVFMRKMEIEETTKRAEYRDWRMVYVELRGTALNIYNVKKERGLEKSYSLLHADAGIAADYRKRRYVIRMRVETDQFLLSCVEIGTFVKWLDAIFAAINISPPIDERDFPRDFSIPRIQRIRWLRGQRPQPEDSIGFARLTEQRRQDGTSDVDEDDDADEPPDPGGSYDDVDNPGPYGPRTDHPIVGRLSTTSYPNESLDPVTGKWKPVHGWTLTHDQLYARLCYSVLLFKSPRKSNYVISRGKRWYVDWETGRMVRVLPPAYGEVDVMGPWQVIMPENRLL